MNNPLIMKIKSDFGYEKKKLDKIMVSFGRTVRFK